MINWRASGGYLAKSADLRLIGFMWLTGIP
jgi:hypothetical protein